MRRESSAVGAAIVSSGFGVHSTPTEGAWPSSQGIGLTASRTLNFIATISTAPLVRSNLVRPIPLQRCMTTMTCKQLGGPCDQKLSAQAWDEMVRNMTSHVMRNHPETAEAMKKKHEANPKKWGRQTKPKWDAAPAA